MLQSFELYCRVLSYIDHLPILISAITGCAFISAFSS